MEVKVHGTDENKYKMMDGSSSSKSYLLFGRKGNMAVGIKIGPVMNGNMVGSPGNTWFGLKLRVAPGGDLLESDANEGVVALKNHVTYKDPAEAFPEITWDKKHHTRCSTVIGVIVRGSPKGELQAFVDQIIDNKLASKISAYLVQLVGHENLVISERMITQYFNEQYGQFAADLLKSAEVEKKANELMEENIGVVAVHADLLKKLYQQTHQGEEATEEKPNSDEHASALDHEEEEEDEDEHQD